MEFYISINFSSCQSLTFLHIFILKYNDQKRILKHSGFCYLRGVFQSVTYFRGVPRCVTECDRVREGEKLVKNSVTYFMDGPYFLNPSIILYGQAEVCHRKD